MLARSASLRAVSRPPLPPGATRAPEGATRAPESVRLAAELEKVADCRLVAYERVRMAHGLKDAGDVRCEPRIEDGVLLGEFDELGFHRPLATSTSAPSPARCTVNRSVGSSSTPKVPLPAAGAGHELAALAVE